MVVRDRKLATQDLYPLSQTPLRFLLADRIDLMRDTNVIGVYADDVFVTVVIEEQQLVVGTHRLMMMFGAKTTELRQWTVTDPQGYDTTVAVYNLDASAVSPTRACSRSTTTRHTSVGVPLSVPGAPASDTVRRVTPSFAGRLGGQSDEARNARRSPVRLQSACCQLSG